MQHYVRVQRALFNRRIQGTLVALTNARPETYHNTLQTHHLPLAAIKLAGNSGLVTEVLLSQNHAAVSRASSYRP